MRDLEQIDWRGCDQVERVPGRLFGRYVIRGTGIEPSVVLIEEDLGRSPEQTRAGFPSLSVETIRAIREYAKSSKFRDNPSFTDRLRRFLRRSA